jgi:hypothetical protein
MRLGRLASDLRYQLRLRVVLPLYTVNRKRAQTDRSRRITTSSIRFLPGDRSHMRVSTGSRLHSAKPMGS